MRAMFRLTARTIAGLNAPGRYADGGGLYLQVRPNGKSWIFRYRRRSGTNSTGREFALREIGLGPLASVSLAEARQKRDAEAAKLNTGIDPLADKKIRRDAATAIKSKPFGVYCDEFLESALAGFKNEKHRAQWSSTLATYAKPIWTTPVDEIKTGHIKEILDPIWNDKRETARRVRGRIERVLSAAKAAGLRDGLNPARWTDNLKAFYGTQAKAEKRHHAAIPFAEMPGFMVDLAKLDSVSARALEFAILTAARTGEVRGARWSEITLADAVWTIPAARMKASKEHRVPLNSRALAILKAMKPGKPEALIFPGAKRGEPLSDAALLMCLRGLRAGVTTHGFRSSFRDWAGDATNFPRDLAELALAHAIKDESEAAYRRGDALERRREMMEAWQGFVCG